VHYLVHVFRLQNAEGPPVATMILADDTRGHRRRRGGRQQGEGGHPRGRRRPQCPAAWLPALAPAALRCIRRLIPRSARKHPSMQRASLALLEIQ
jgi:hypothetical protein